MTSLREIHYNRNTISTETCSIIEGTTTVGINYYKRMRLLDLTKQIALVVEEFYGTAKIRYFRIVPNVRGFNGISCGSELISDAGDLSDIFS